MFKKLVVVMCCCLLLSVGGYAAKEEEAKKETKKEIKKPEYNKEDPTNVVTISTFGKYYVKEHEFVGDTPGAVRLLILQAIKNEQVIKDQGGVIQKYNKSKKKRQGVLKVLSYFAAGVAGGMIAR